MLRTFKVLAMIVYEDGRKVVTTNVVRAMNKEEARRKVVLKYRKSPGSVEIIINTEKDIVQLI